MVNRERQADEWKASHAQLIAEQAEHRDKHERATDEARRHLAAARAAVLRALSANDAEARTAEAAHHLHRQIRTTEVGEHRATEEHPLFVWHRGRESET